MPQPAPTRSHRRTLGTAVGLAVAAALTLGACSTAAGVNSADPVEPGQRVSIVASTNVWGSVAAAVAGDRADVVSIVSDPAADPHSYEASPRDAARLTDAHLVVYNGGGYDGFLDDILASMPDKSTVDAFSLHGSATDLHGEHSPAAEAAPAAETAPAAEEHPEADGHDHDHDHGGVNEHVWYDIATVDAVAQRIATELATLDPTNAAAYAANADDFHDELHRITAVTDSIAKAHPQAPVAQTEPIAHYLLAAADLHDQTPEDFTRAIEEGNDPPPAAIAATRELLADKKVDALIYNSQTQDRVTQSVRTAAESAGIPVVEVSETLPEGVTYVQWQAETAAALAAALDGSTR
ncbi:metal ABC transporter solute-binding protein, Zn/Mn family [Rhodococcus kronopolitis]|uniref:Metal ABC transporter solute-binding protein, Zn/Mn family n=1 Tax=Rhodococcus kronopolitis TaxID=1460226 RepID=A0ABV9FNX3_9NOCA